MKLFFVSTFIGILFAVTLTFVNRHQKKANKLLAVCFVSMSAFLFELIGINSNLFLSIPVLYHVLTPLQFLIAPTAYLYIRALLLGDIRFRKTDWIHFVPAIIVFFIYLPYFFVENDIKTIGILHVAGNHIQQFSEEGLLLPYLLFTLKVFITVSYLFFQWQIIKKWMAEIIKAPNVYKYIFKWLKLFSVLVTFFQVVILVLSTVAIAKISLSFYAILSFEYVLCLSFLAILLYLFFNPKILFGMLGNIVFYQFKPGNAETSDEISLEEFTANESEYTDTESDIKVFSLTPEQVNTYKRQLDVLMREKRAFLTQGYTLKDASSILHIPKHHLSLIINTEFKMNFNDFINSYRVDFLKDKMLEPGSEQLTLDGLAKEAGFSSRTTFFRAFTKFTGQAPSDFLKAKS
jgi:AraC-like DNA-binding protein